MKNALMLSALLASAPCSAITFQGAVENLLYFEYAQLASDHCQKQGIATRPILAAWQARHESLYGQSIDSVRAEGKRRGLDKMEDQNTLLFELLAVTKQKAEEHIARRGVLCTKFAPYLDFLRSSFKP